MVFFCVRLSVLVLPSPKIVRIPPRHSSTCRAVRLGETERQRDRETERETEKKFLFVSTSTAPVTHSVTSSLVVLFAFPGGVPPRTPPEKVLGEGVKKTPPKKKKQSGFEPVTNAVVFFLFRKN